MISKETVQYVNESLKYSIKEYLPIKEKILLYDMLVTSSIIAKTPMFCSQQDIDAFKALRENCRLAEIDLDKYISCAYSYIMKYSTPGHRLSLGYFLNDKVIEYCGDRIASTKSTLLLDQISEDILSTEKQIRLDMTEFTLSYEKSFGRQVKLKRISDTFVAYKKYTHSPLVAGLNTVYLTKLVEILEPYFIYILDKNCIYTPHNIKAWNNSKIEDFNFCPIYFKDRYVTGELTDSVLGNSATSQGTAVHKIFEDILTKVKKAKKLDLEGTAKRHFNSKAYTEIKEELKEHTPFIESLFLKPTDSILHQLINKDTKILIEHKMTAEMSGLSFYGTADLILVNGNHATILDYKSSKLDPKYLPKNNEKYLKQLSLYAALLYETDKDIHSVDAIIIYTRGLIYKFPKILSDIASIRSNQIREIIHKLSNGMIQPNRSSCFLCRHPNCKSRGRESIWNEQGNRKAKTAN